MALQNFASTENAQYGPALLGRPITAVGWVVSYQTRSPQRRKNDDYRNAPISWQAKLRQRINEAVINLECKSQLKVALRPVFTPRVPRKPIYL
jgi:hypothetical protein